MILLLLACNASAPWADVVVEAPGADERPDGFDDPTRAANGARGGGTDKGGTDVYSLDRNGPRTHLVLSFSDVVIIDGEGPDLVVFENAFSISSGGNFMDPTVVEVSDDGETFVPFPHSLDGIIYTTNPEAWHGFAGLQPVVHHQDKPRTPAVYREAAGGDRFDLADVGLSRATHVRLSPALDFPSDPVSNGPDIDAVYGLHYETAR